MKTSTLIVRLAGFYLLASCSLPLLQLRKTRAMAGPMGGPPDALVADFQRYCWVGLLIGLGAALFAGPLARLLTFDSEPRTRRTSSVDSYLGR